MSELRGRKLRCEGSEATNENLHQGPQWKMDYRAHGKGPRTKEPTKKLRILGAEKVKKQSPHLKRGGNQEFIEPRKGKKKVGLECR